jgi:cysteine desulfurase
LSVYLDSAASAPVLDQAARVFSQTAALAGNPSSTHAAGREKKRVLEAARAEILAAAGFNPNDGCVFTSGGTEADNLAIAGFCMKNARAGRHIITSQAEHDAVLNTVKSLERQGFSATYLAPGKSGVCDPDALKSALRGDTVLVSLMAVNNETGAIAPIEEYARIVRENSRAALHADAVQAFGKLPPQAYCCADMVSVSAHKIGGLPGTGALLLRGGVKLSPVLHGGEQESGLRAGTENVPAAAAFAAAAKIRGEQREAEFRRLRGLRERLIGRMREIDGFCLTLDGSAEASPYILSFSLPGYPAEIMTTVLSDEGFFVSRSSACKKGRRSHVLAAMGLPGGVAESALRVSFSPETREEDVTEFAGAIIRITQRIIRKK